MTGKYYFSILTRFFFFSSLPELKGNVECLRYCQSCCFSNFTFWAKKRMALKGFIFVGSYKCYNTIIASISWTKRYPGKRKRIFKIMIENVRLLNNKCWTDSKGTIKPYSRFNNIAIPWSDYAKYLGVTVDRRLTWKKHILNIRGKVAGASKALNALLNSHDLSIHNKLLLYNACILPIITYACPIWGFTCDSSMDNLSKLHNKHLRRVRGASRYLRNTTIRKDLSTISFRKRVNNLAKKFYQNLYNLPNDIIAELPDYEVSNLSHRKRPRFSTIINSE